MTYDFTGRQHHQPKKNEYLRKNYYRYGTTQTRVWNCSGHVPHVDWLMVLNWSTNYSHFQRYVHNVQYTYCSLCRRIWIEFRMRIIFEIREVWTETMKNLDKKNVLYASVLLLKDRITYFIKLFGPNIKDTESNSLFICARSEYVDSIQNQRISLYLKVCIKILINRVWRHTWTLF